MTTMINTKSIYNMKPCRQGLDLWLQHYSDTNVTPREFINLEKIGISDKIWVLIRLMDLDSRVNVMTKLSKSSVRLYKFSKKRLNECIKTKDKKLVRQLIELSFVSEPKDCEVLRCVAYASRAIEQSKYDFMICENTGFEYGTTSNYIEACLSYGNLFSNELMFNILLSEVEK